MSGPRPAVTKPTTAQYFSLMKSPFVKIYVGERAEPVDLPKDLLAYYSPYFRAAFNGNFKEGVEGVLRRPDEKPRFMDAIVDYMRSGSANLNMNGLILDGEEE